MMRKNNNNPNRNNNMKHRGGQGGGQGQRRYQSNGGGGGNRGNDSGNIARQKHHATQMREKYSNMARDAQINGDRVDVEYYLQHVDHYTRVLTDITAIEAERYAHQREQQIIAGGPNDPNAQQSSGNNNEQAESNDNNGEPAPQSDASSNEGSAAEVNAEFSGTQRQPRMTRQPRRQHSDNGAKEANSNTNEIPLPDSILPPI